MTKDSAIYPVVIVMCIVTTGGINIHTKIDSCTTANNKHGQCIVLTECEYLYNLTKLPVVEGLKEYLKKSYCGDNKSKIKVCCSLTDEISSTDLTKVAVLSTAERASKLGIELPTLDECGIFSEYYTIHGSTTLFDEYPWQALLEYKKPEGHGFHCGGVLISKRYILTAAHCVTDIPADWTLFSVRLGEHDTTTDLDCVEFAQIKDCALPVEDIPIETKIIHKNYKKNDINKYYDLALLRLTKPVMFSDFIRPICLPPYEQEDIQEPIRISGWGANGQLSANGVKKHALISTEDNTACRNLTDLGVPMQLRNDQICLVQTRRYHNICNTDSGGALMAHSSQNVRRTNNYFAVGVLSLIPSDCSQEKPLVGTKVTSYLQWILENMLP